MSFSKYKQELERNGYAIIARIYSVEEVKNISKLIESADQNNPSFLRTNDLFAIRQLLQTIPDLSKCILNENMKKLIRTVAGEHFFITKAIYFDKPGTSNWFVPFHQDISISVTEKHDTNGYSSWTNKRGQIGVHPPIDILRRTITLRIHLDDTDETNGALRIISGSHLKDIYQTGSLDFDKNQEVICSVESAGVMLMKPLTLHASKRSSYPEASRRVIHLEICDCELTPPIEWKEKLSIQ